METIYLPRRLVEKIREKGVDLDDLLLKVLKETLNLDPVDAASFRIDFARKYLEEARKYLAEKDAVQASEKLYKAVEECIKALAEVLDTKSYREAYRRGRWSTWLLGKASTEASKILGEEKITLIWSKAYEIHVWGFHEMKYGVEELEIVVPLVEWLLKYTEKIIERKNK